jgi:hypothetical protein
MRPGYACTRNQFVKETAMPQLVLEDLNLANAERRLCVEALTTGGNIVNAAGLLGITRHALKRRIVKLRIEWPQAARRPAEQAAATATAIPG